MNLHIRQEQPQDYQTVFNLIEKAFQNKDYSDKREQFLVERLRNSNGFIPELSLVAEVDHQIVGHILLTEIKIESTKENIISLALAPVSVLPEFQGKGIGGELIKSSHSIAQKLNYQSIILLGHESYYPKFGYTAMHHFNISLPFEAPKENCMAIELFSGALTDISGKVIYPKEFFE